MFSGEGKAESRDDTENRRQDKVEERFEEGAVEEDY